MSLTRALKAAALSLAVLAAPAIAHTDAVLAELTAPHGGQLRVAGAYHLEFVVDAKADGKAAAPIKVYVTDHAGNPSEVAGVKGTLTLLGTGGKATADLAPEGKGVMSASVTYVADTKLKAIVALSFPGGSVEQARFALIDKK
jgi:hypothetical protein